MNCYLCDWPEVVERGDHGQGYCRDHSRGDKPLRPAVIRAPIDERRWQLQKRTAMRTWVPLTPLIAKVAQ